MRETLAQRPLDGVAVHHGETLIGFILPHLSGCVEAVRQGGSSLGLFNDQTAAAKALLIASRPYG